MGSLKFASPFACLKYLALLANVHFQTVNRTAWKRKFFYSRDSEDGGNNVHPRHDRISTAEAQNWEIWSQKSIRLGPSVPVHPVENTDKMNTFGQARQITFVWPVISAERGKGDQKIYQVWLVRLRHFAELILKHEHVGSKHRLILNSSEQPNRHFQLH